MWPALRRGSMAVTVILVCLGITAPAWGHSFLATTRPAQGERLNGPPREVALQLSEPVDADTVRVDVTDGGVPVAVGQLELDDGGAVVRLPLVSPGDGLYRVEWHVTRSPHEARGRLPRPVSRFRRVYYSYVVEGRPLTHQHRVAEPHRPLGRRRVE